MRERDVEQAFVHSVKQTGGQALKLTSPGTAGMPDRLVILPGGCIGFVELKAPGQKPRALQQHRIAQLRALGCTVLIVDHPDQIPEAILEIRAA